MDGGETVEISSFFIILAAGENEKANRGSKTEAEGPVALRGDSSAICKCEWTFAGQKT